MVTVSPEMIHSMSSKLEVKGVTKEELDKLIDNVSTGGGDVFTDLDLTTDDGYRMYVKICDTYLKIRQPNPLGITGIMLADGAKMAYQRYHKFVPAELALAQLAAEGGIGNGDMNSIPVKTKNPFDVANTETSSKSFNTVESGINAYYTLIATDYLGKGRTAEDLIHKFVNKLNLRYAGALNYENVVASIAKKVNKIAKTLENNA